jgi:anti-sigma factor RsiW
MTVPMSTLCNSIETLAMAYLDDELAEAELRDLELHLIDCAACRARVEGDRETIGELRHQLVAPPAPDLLRARLARALDAEDALVARASWRTRLARWALPGAASLAAVGALALFAFGRSAPADDAVAQEAIRQHVRGAPLEVQGASTAAWVQRYFRSNVAPPRFADANVQLAGARLTSVDNRDAAQFFYRLENRSGTYDLRALTFPADGVDFAGAQPVRVDGVDLMVDRRSGHSVVIFLDNEGYAYVFTSADLAVGELAGLVVHSDLVLRVHDSRLGR